MKGDRKTPPPRPRDAEPGLGRGSAHWAVPPTGRAPAGDGQAHSWEVENGKGRRGGRMSIPKNSTRLSKTHSRTPREVKRGGGEPARTCGQGALLWWGLCL